MVSCKRGIRIFGIIVASIIGNLSLFAAPYQSVSDYPVLEKIIINNDSIILPADRLSDSGNSNSGQIILAHRNNNISFEIGSSTFLKDMMLFGHFGKRQIIRNTQTFRQVYIIFM
jgi:hypothetical protein